MNDQMNPEAMPAEQPQQPGMQPEQEVEASPEEQQAHDSYVKEALKPIASDGNIWQGMLKTLRAGKPRLPETVAMLAVRLYTLAEDKLGPMDDEDLSEAIAETIIEQLLIAGIGANILSETEVTEDLAAEIYLRFVKIWTDQNPERVSDEDRAAAKGGQPGQPQQQPAAQAPQQPNILGGMQ